MCAAKIAKLPSLLYGTAWKKDKTQDLVKQALQSGFRAVDTAAQPKHYQENLVGAGIRDALRDGSIKREDLYIQTKYTSTNGQDPKAGMPYNPRGSITDQVHASVASSLANLQHVENGAQPYIDCLVLHSPFSASSQTLEAWRAMETHVPGEVHTLGISNCYDLHELQALYDTAAVKPSVLQNRFYRESGYDRSIRAFCQSKGIVYQSFWTLTANPHLLESQPVLFLRDQAEVSKEVALYSLVLGLGNISVLCGTTNADRMRDNLKGVAAVQAWSTQHSQQWNELVAGFDSLLG
ncbi:Putative NADP-dependent oxidoreductase domain-containing protein [Septoria linicola]|uniref:NADP-dependent oxidoreductase domain-containing protein n=1 Tax=Septoria linicola TaxID=215465 RepID=A0A9Q9AMU9_9PEZI|nr:putative NADP-dependent oxidoreductase domain-containing protein [Septoria linicola]USW52204.1 Putative NADP-dependent oxidoreductase domain-containing protein [Septoria linicola]